MNLVQRMVAENKQSVTSQELAEAAGMSHEEICQMISEYRSDIEEFGTTEMQNGQYELNANQTLLCILLIPMSEENPPTSSDELKSDLKISYIKVFSARVKGFTERTGEYPQSVSNLFNSLGGTN